MSLWTLTPALPSQKRFARAVLLVLVILDQEPPATAVMGPYSFDPRIVVEGTPAEAVEDWEAALYGLPDMWTRAERVVAERKSLTLPSTSKVG
ncbi:hypothetical protein MVEN_01489300 [Mycena venus]|uniref:DUF5753 domain-containing protein n=1 Tax=Mycena venus TaxID=2733690 RepID=A0A8H7CT60_9AGAR|nr:hypothetical protein MVEN_01489300 [Mycena venus]